MIYKPSVSERIFDISNYIFLALLSLLCLYPFWYAIIIAFNPVYGLCWTTHDVLWIAWRAIGEYMGDNKLDWAKGLNNKTIRRMIAECFKMVCKHDTYMLDDLKKGFNP
jgi:ABC-type glycerol-3-phosphate transport system permease component